MAHGTAGLVFILSVLTKLVRTSMQKSPRMVPGALSNGFVAPSIFRPVATASLPSHTIQTTGPLSM